MGFKLPGTVFTRVSTTICVVLMSMWILNLATIGFIEGTTPVTQIASPSQGWLKPCR